MQFPAWLFLSLFAFTYLLSCALKLNDDDDDDDEKAYEPAGCRGCRHPESAMQFCPAIANFFRVVASSQK